MAYLDKHNIAEYIIWEYKEKTGYEISETKLQKGMYYLFSTWGGEIRRLNRSLYSDSEKLAMDEYLFEASFKAGDDGPIDMDISKRFKDKGYYKGMNKELKIADQDMRDTIEEFIEPLLDEIFSLNDFLLIDMTRTEKEWIRASREDIEFLIMNNEHIIGEYSKM